MLEQSSGQGPTQAWLELRNRTEQMLCIYCIPLHSGSHAPETNVLQLLLWCLLVVRLDFVVSCLFPLSYMHHHPSVFLP